MFIAIEINNIEMNGGHMCRPNHYRFVEVANSDFLLLINMKVAETIASTNNMQPAPVAKFWFVIKRVSNL